jgi:hypothetical protein
MRRATIDFIVDDVLAVSWPYSKRTLKSRRTSLQKTRPGARFVERVLTVSDAAMNPWIQGVLRVELDGPVDVKIDPATIAERGGARFASTFGIRGPEMDASRPRRNQSASKTWGVEIEYRLVSDIEGPDIGVRAISTDEICPAGFDVRRRSRPSAGSGFSTHPSAPGP